MLGQTLRLGIALAAIAVCAGSAPAAEMTVKNDSYVQGGSVFVVGDFVAGEQAGARLTAPCDGAIVAVQVAWLSSAPSGVQSLERAIHVYDGSTFPIPGTEWLFLEAPLLTEGAINEFRYVDENQTIPINIPVTAGQQFYVTLEFDNPTNIANGTPSVIRDTTGCQDGKNILYAIPGGWLNFCIFLSGDLVIRAVVQCPDPTGACCFPTGACQVLSSTDCAQQGGTYQGNGVTCAQANCPQPAGACCFPATESCVDFTQAQCTTAGGIWAGAGTDCDTFVCFPRGACCLPDGSCTDDQTPDACAQLDGVFQGHQTTCAAVTCPEPEGACCFASTGGCLLLNASTCAMAGGAWKGYGTDCSDLNGNGTADDCEQIITRGDMNCDGNVNALDINPFVQAMTNQSAYYTQFPTCNHLNGDTNCDGAVNALDINLFVSCITQTGGCPPCP